MRHFTALFSILACLAFFSCKNGEILSYETSGINPQDDDSTAQVVDDDYTYQLPVIFHVFYQTYNDSVKALAPRLLNVLGNVNDLYDGNIYGWKGGYSENINLDFVPALTDEDGNALATPGVEFVKWDGEFPIDAERFMNSKRKEFIWEPNEYINVMVFPFTSNESEKSVLLGISHMPYTLDDSTRLAGLETAGARYLTKQNLSYPYSLSINSIYVNQESSRYTQEDKGQRGFIYRTTDINTTLAHELGHYLGLHHVFAETKTKKDGIMSYEETDTCEDSDDCDDTPSYNRIEYARYLKTLDSKTPFAKFILRHDCSGNQYDSVNMMDYSVGLCIQFTAEQKRRIRHVLYYCPLIPGPKLNKTNTRSLPVGIIDLPITISK